ncbi:MAG: peptidyl-prolyl cis-trans isomerase [Epsilonproteobacteria bacterium]|nr:peptidyl-prolyl cis-trans isomerase [Campylobacterota bacterium]
MYYAQTQVQTNTQKKSVIDISKYEIQQIKSKYKKEWAREISEVELKALITQRYYDKVLLEEAYLLNLQKQDEVISKRLLEKMHFVMLNTEKIIEPTQKQLYEYYKKNIVDYSVVSSISFTHIFFNLNVDKKKLDAVLKLLKTVKVDIQRVDGFGDSFQKSTQVENINFEDAKDLFGNYFAYKLFKLKSGVWNNAIRSKFGNHIIYVKDKNVTTPYTFDEVQGRVYEDFMQEFKDNIEKKAYKRVLSSYELKVE